MTATIPQLDSWLITFLNSLYTNIKSLTGSQLYNQYYIEEHISNRVFPNAWHEDITN